MPNKYISVVITLFKIYIFLNVNPVKKKGYLNNF